METQTIHSVIEAEYPRWLGIAESIARRRNMSGWGGDALDEVLVGMLSRKSTFRWEGEDVRGRLAAYIAGAVAKTIFALFHGQHIYTDIEKRLPYLASGDVADDQEPDDVWRVRRETEAKSRDDSFEFEHSAISADDLPFAPAACMQYRATQFHAAHGNAAPRVQVAYRVVVRDAASHSKMRTFTTAAQASLYARTVRAKIAQQA